MADAALALSSTARIFQLLGGAKVFGRRSPKNDLDLIPFLREGFPVSAFEAATRALDISESELYRCLKLSPRTLARRKKEARLSPVESESVLRVLQVTARAEEVLGSQDAARQWLRRPNRSLGSVAPISLLDTALGLTEVMNILGRIEHGIVG